MSPVSNPLSGGAAAAARPNPSRDPQKVHDAARQFEALLLGQMLRTERQSGSGWLGTGEDSSSECAIDYAEQQFAAVLASQGGLGIANLVAKGLEYR